MSVVSEPDYSGKVLVDVEGNILGNVLLIQRDENDKVVITVDLFVPPASSDDTFHDENTMAKVVLALYDQGLNFTDAGKIIDAILNKGIVFREIVKPE